MLQNPAKTEDNNPYIDLIRKNVHVFVFFFGFLFFFFFFLGGGGGFLSSQA